MAQPAHTNLTEAAEAGGGLKAVCNSPAFSGVLLILVVTLLAYSSVFSAGFNWDDDDHVIRIASLGGLDGLKKIWFEPGATIQYYPLVFTAFWMQIKLWGLAPLGFHLVNIVLHALNAVLVWRVLLRLGVRGAFWAGCIFALHPLHVESVAWITELKNLLSALFYLLALLCWFRFAELRPESGGSGGAGRSWYAASLILFTAALLSKSVACTLPAVILLLIWWQRGKIGRTDILPLIPFFLLALAIGLITLRVEADYNMAKGPEWAFSAMERLLIAGRVTWFHAWKMIWPHPLMFNYPRWQLDARAWWQYLFPAAVLALLLLLWLCRRRLGRGPLAAVLFVVGTNFPVLGFLNVYSMRFSFVADHYYYLANIGLIVLFCSASGLLVQRCCPSLRHGERCFFGAVLLILALLTWQQGGIYENRLTLFNDTLAKNPASWLSYGNRALYYANEGRYDLAMVDLDRTLALKPDEADALHNRGRLFYERRDFSRAFADLDRAIAIRPWRPDYYKTRSLAWLAAGEPDNALADADRIVAMASWDARNYLHRAAVQAERQDLAAALVDLNRAAGLKPDDFQIYANRGLIRYRQGLLAEALRDYDRALGLNPESAETFFNRGLAHVAAGAVDQARIDLAKARELGYPLDDGQIGRILSSAKK